jgi:hypothetical protein
LSLKGVTDAGTPEQQAAYAELVKSILVAEPPPAEEAQVAEVADATAPAAAFDENAFLAKIGDLVKPVSDAAEAAAKAAGETAAEVKTIAERVKQLEDGAVAEKERQGNAPRAAGMFRASEAESTQVDAAKVKEILGEGDADSAQYASPYVADLIQVVGGRS